MLFQTKKPYFKVILTKKKKYTSLTPLEHSQTNPSTQNTLNFFKKTHNQIRLDLSFST